MSGVWVFKNGVYRLVQNPKVEGLDGRKQGKGQGQGKDWAPPVLGRRKVLVYLPTNEVISSYTILEQKLLGLGWEMYYEDLSLLQFHKRTSMDLISLPREFSNFRTVHMYDIVVKNRDMFEVRDVS